MDIGICNENYHSVSLICTNKNTLNKGTIGFLSNLEQHQPCAFQAKEIKREKQKKTNPVIFELGDSLEYEDEKLI